MEILRKPPTVRAPAATFSGEVWYDVIAKGQEPSPVWVNLARLEQTTDADDLTEPVGPSA